MNKTDGFTAEQLNAHYAAISTDAHYVVPGESEANQLHPVQFTEEQIFEILDKLKPTSPGLDRIPSWFLRISAPVLAASSGGIVQYIHANVCSSKTVEVQYNHSSGQSI